MQMENNHFLIKYKLVDSWGMREESCFVTLTTEHTLDLEAALGSLNLAG